MQLEPRVLAGWLLAGLVALLAVIGATQDVRVAPAVVGAALAVMAAAAVLREPRWLIVGLAFAVYATLFEAAQGATGLPVSKRAALLAAVALLAWRRSTGSEIRTPTRRDIGLVAAMLATIFLSAVAATDVAVTFERAASVATAAVAALVISTMCDVKWLARTMWAVAAAGASLAALSLYQQVTGTYGNTYFGLAVAKFDGAVVRSGGPFEPNFFAQALVVSTALATYLALRARRPSERFTGLTVAALCIAGIGATASRGGVIALAVMLLVGLALRRPPLSVLLPAAAVAVIAAAFLVPPETEQRITTVFDTADFDRSLVEDTSVRGRFAENLSALAMFRDRPLLGVGAHNFPVRYAEYVTFAGNEWRPVREPHNLYLETLAETGVVGGIVFAVFLWATLSGAWRARRRAVPRDALLAEGVFVALVGALVTGVFLHGSYTSILWTTFGLAWAAGSMILGAKAGKARGQC